MSFRDFQPLIQAVAERSGWDPALLAAQAWAESGFNPLAVSMAGARGLMQFMPRTWQEWGGGRSITDPEASLESAVDYLRWISGYLGEGLASPTELALAAYNWGPGNVRNLIGRTGRTDWAYLQAMVPAETRNYVNKILSKVPSYREAFQAPAATESAPAETQEGPGAVTTFLTGEAGWTSYAMAGALVLAALLGVLLLRRAFQ